MGYMTSSVAVLEKRSAPVASTIQMKNVVPILKPDYSFVDFLKS